VIALEGFIAYTNAYLRNDWHYV